MPYLPRFTWKAGINPSQASRIDVNNPTGTQKLRMISARIFCENIGGNLHSGNKVLSKILKGKARLRRYYYPMLGDLREAYPYFYNPDIVNRKIKAEEGRKLRVLMRGVKIGRAKGGGRIPLVNVFEKKGEKPPGGDE